MQQDGENAHTRLPRPVTGCERALERAALSGGWPEQYEDLISLDFSIWGHLKVQVHRMNRKSSKELKEVRGSGHAGGVEV